MRSQPGAGDLSGFVTKEDEKPNFGPDLELGEADRKAYNALSKRDRFWAFGGDIYDEDSTPKAPVAKKPTQPMLTERDLREQLALFKMAPEQIEENVAQWKIENGAEERVEMADQVQGTMAPESRYRGGHEDAEEETCADVEGYGDDMEMYNDTEEVEDAMEGLES